MHIEICRDDADPNAYIITIPDETDRTGQAVIGIIIFIPVISQREMEQLVERMVNGANSEEL
jgi:hypothetical protein